MSPSPGNDLIGILSKLVSYKTVSGNTNEMTQCFDYLEDHLVRSNLKITRLSSNNLPSLMATSQLTRSPKVLLQAHVDVVPAKTDAFKLSRRDGKLYGRGVFDMKFAAACYMQLARELKDDINKYDFGLLLTSDEEIGGENGVSFVLNNGYSAKICILPDGGNDWHIETTCNSVWLVSVCADGQSAHGSRPWEGRNAINALLDGLTEVHSLFGELKPYQNSITISQIRGGSAMNQVPDRAEATLDMRFINESEYQARHAELEQIAKKRQLKLTTIAHVKARNVDTEQPEIKQFLSIAGQLHGKKIASTHSFGASDACYFAEHGIPVIVIRPTGGGPHSDNEWMNEADLQQFYKVIKQYVVQTTKITPAPRLT